MESMMLKKSKEVTDFEYQMFILSKKLGTSDLYTETWAFKLSDHISMSKLEMAILSVIEKNEDIHSRFVMVEDALKKVLNVNHDVLEIIDSTEIELMNLIEDLKSEKFDVEEDALIRFYLYHHRSSNEGYLLINSHHILTDSVTKNILLNKIFNEYDDKIDSLAIKTIENDQGINKNPLLNLESYKSYLAKIINYPDRANPYGAIKENIDGHVNHILFSEEFLDKVTSICKTKRITPVTFYLSTFYTFLCHELNTTQFRLGIPFSSRSNSNESNKIGYFVNTLPFGMDIGDFSSYKQLLKHVQLELFKLDEYKTIASSHISDITSSMNGNLYRTVFSYQETEPLDQIDSEVYTSQNGAKFELTVNFKKTKNSLQCEMEFSDETWSLEESSRFIHRFKRWMLRHVVEEFDWDVLNIKNNQNELVLEEDSYQLRGEFSSQKSDSIYDRFSSYSNHSTYHYAISHNKHCINYKDLNDKVINFSHRLLNLGLDSSQVVALRLNRSIDTIALIFALSKVGITHVHLSEMYPLDRTEYILKDSKASLLICEETTNSDDELLLEKITWIDFYQIDDTPPISVQTQTKNEIFSLIYTSGTTGEPKGVKIKNESIINFSSNHMNFITNPNEVFTHVSTYTFDAWFFEVMLPLLNGKTLIVVNSPITDEKNWHFGEKDVLPTVSFLTTALFNSFVDSKLIKKIHSIQKYVIGGEKVSPRHVENAFKQNENIEIINAYGPTENTTFTTIYKIPKQVPRDIPIGTPLTNTNVIITGPNMEILPKNCYGEIMISGRNLMQGYLNKGNDKLIESNVNGLEEMYYKTGDIGKIGLDNQLYYLHRKDRQVKIRGFRIELSEIEQKLMQINGITKCVVQVEDEINRKKLIAYFTGTLDVENLKKHAEFLLPKYMLPNQYILLEEIKLTINGKIDKSSVVEAIHINENTNLVWSHTEKMILEAISKVTKNENADKNENFYSLGIDSISSLQVCSLLRSKGMDISVSEFFKYQSIASLANYIEESNKLGEIRDVTRQVWTENTLSPIQKWFFDTQPNHPSHWNQTVLIKLSDEHHIETIVESLEKLVNQFNIFSSIFTYEDGNWIQKIMEDRSYHISVQSDVSEMNLDDVLASNQKRIDIRKNLYHFSIIRVADKTYVQLVIHHLIIDGVSWRVLLSQLSNNLEDNSEILTERKSFNEWVQYLDDFEVSKVSRLFWDELDIELEPKLTVNYSDIHYLEMEFNLYQTKELKEKVIHHFMGDLESTLLGISAKVINKVIQNLNETMVVQLEGHGRPMMESDFSSTIGWFTSIYPIQLKCEESTSDTILKTHKIISEIPNKAFDYSLQKSLKFKSDWTFNFMGDFNSDAYQGFEVSEMFRTDDFSKESLVPYSLQIVPIVVDDKLSIKVFFNEKLYSTVQIQTLIKELNEELLTFIDSKSERYLPVSGMKEGMLIQHEASEETGDYIIQWTMDTPNIDLNKFQVATNTLIRKVDALRSVFTFIDGNGYEIIKEASEVSRNYMTTIFDWSLLADDEVERETKRYLKNQKSIGFDFTNGPLFRFTVIKKKTNFTVIFEFHHIILDGWSMSQLFDSLSKAYEHGVEVDLHDYAQVRMNLETLKSYSNLEEWDGVLSNYTPIKFMNTSGIDERIQRFGSNSISSVLSQYLKTNNLTMNEFYMLAWSITLSKAFGKKDILFGATISGRNTLSMQELNTVGMFIATLPVRMNDFDVTETSALITAIKQNMKRMQDYDYISWLDISKKLKENSEIQIGYVFENYPVSDNDGMFSISNFDGQEQVEFPLALSVVQKGQEIIHEMTAKSSEVSSELLDTIEALFEAVVSGLIQHSNDYSYLTKRIHDNTRLFSPPREVTNSEVDLRSELLRGFKKFSDNVFIKQEEKSLTYAQTLNMIEQIIRTTNLSSDDVVVVKTEDRLKKTIYLLSCLLSGATYVPVSQEYNEKRIDYILENAAANCLFDSEGKFQRISERSKNGGLAYIIYTSGSTGEPKGVKVTSQNLSNFISSMNDYTFISQEDVYYQNIAMTFDPSIMDVLLPMTVGAKMYIPLEKMMGDELEELLVKEQITIMTCTPSLLKNMDLTQTKSLKTLFVGGEKLTFKDIKHVPDTTTIVNMYGPTEATITSTLFVITSSNKYEFKSYPIGRPLKHMKYAIQSKDGMRLPYASPGQLILKGPMISPGYIDDQLTKKHFRKVVSSEVGTKYETGDFVLETKDHSIHYLDRDDDQIKLRGYRIELQEIEVVLDEVTSIHDYHLMLVNNKTSLALFYRGEIENGQLRQKLTNKLPTFMIPSIIKQVDVFPTTINGKIAVDELLDAKANSIANSLSYTENTDETYMTIHSIWLDTLNVNQLNEKDNFFELGGNSLLAIQVVKKVNNALYMNVSIKTLFKYPTLLEFVTQTRRGEMLDVPN
ncbi:hypothetical protein ADM98_00840 [Exiguobacterium sp. BMC-KP]|uniref:condensation domain-containing protein n=1 Tax=Exiguobacterium sp. BMC-KP TaxID=1684312 RepID=UPI0006AA50D9|nr:condensation domain-containing protein [Exiguobacterium sp. BMC-KP]KOP31426.1 hypothetical protein ADM98_00840 [Exiguobacterium sp. BMC-KP]